MAGGIVRSKLFFIIANRIFKGRGEDLNIQKNTGITI